jgi:hypothetical protein
VGRSGAKRDILSQKTGLSLLDMNDIDINDVNIASQLVKVSWVSGS